MARITKEELINRYSPNFEGDDDKLMQFMEDVTDSVGLDNAKKIEEVEKLQNELEKVTSERDSIKEKYIARFTEGSPVRKEEIINEPREAEVIDIREI